MAGLKTTLIIMIGLQCSGKSTMAKCFGQIMDATIISSDDIRKENPEFDNDAVFKLLYERARYLLKNGDNVIIDATNITIKARKSIFDNIFNGKDRVDRQSVEVLGYLINIPIEQCRERLQERNARYLRGQENENGLIPSYRDFCTHYVPEEVLERYYKSFQVPFKEEGFDDIYVMPPNSYYETSKHYYLERMANFDQKSKYHTLTLLEHSEKVNAYCKEHKCLDDDLYKDIGLLHDIGKLYTQTIDEDGYAHYYGHENVGAYELLTKSVRGCQQTPYDCYRDYMLVLIVNYHMLPYSWKTEKAKNKWKQIFGEELFEVLLAFNECDKMAH